MYTVADLADIILRLKRFIRADVARCDRALVFAMADPSPQASVRVVRARTLCTVPDVATIAPPTGGLEIVTRSELASAMAAQTAEVLSALRAHGALGIPRTPPAPDIDGSGGVRRQPKPKSGQSRGGADDHSHQRSGSSHGDSARSRGGADGLCRRCSNPLPPPGPYHTKMLRDQRPGWGPRHFCPRCSTTRKLHFAALAGWPRRRPRHPAELREEPERRRWERRKQRGPKPDAKDSPRRRCDRSGPHRPA